MKKILITGAAGHIGSSLIRNLKNFNKIKFILLDNMKTNHHNSYFNLNRKFKIIDQDLLNFDISKLKKLDLIIHLAAETDASDQKKFKKKEFKKYNFELTKKVVNYCKLNKTRLIHISSTSVYGSQTNLVDEDEPIKSLNPESLYAIQKIKEESYIKKNLNNYIILRFGTIFGYSKGMRFHTAINKFIWQSFLGQPITVWKSNLMLPRPYLALKDAINFLKLLIKNNFIKNEIFNLVTANYTLYEVIKILKKFNTKLKIKLVKPPILNQTSYFVDNKKSLKSGFRYKGNLEKEIKHMCQKILKKNE